MNNIDKFFLNSSSKADFAASYIHYVSEVIQSISSQSISSFIDVILETRENKGNIYFIGNGGSAATASHFANDISIGTRSWDKPFRAISLCDNQSIITAIANDYGYDYIFSKQLSVLLSKNDLVVAISASGNSTNLIEAINFANNLGVLTVGLTAFDGGKLKKIVDYSVHVPTEKGEYGPAEDAHMLLDHLVGNYLLNHCKSKG
jgi:D-sedoheptulose 7-phosphate isomerase